VAVEAAGAPSAARTLVTLGGAAVPAGIAVLEETALMGAAVLVGTAATEPEGAVGAVATAEEGGAAAASGAPPAAETDCVAVAAATSGFAAAVAGAAECAEPAVPIEFASVCCGPVPNHSWCMSEWARCCAEAAAAGSTGVAFDPRRFAAVALDGGGIACTSSSVSASPDCGWVAAAGARMESRASDREALRLRRAMENNRAKEAADPFDRRRGGRVCAGGAAAAGSAGATRGAKASATGWGANTGADGRVAASELAGAAEGAGAIGAATAE